MATIAKGLLTFGLGGDNTNLILGQFGVGPLSVDVEVIPPGGTPGAGGYGKPYIPKPEDQWQTIRFTIRYKNEKWIRTYKVSRIRAVILIRITAMLNTISTNISIGIGKMKRLINKIRIK